MNNSRIIKARSKSELYSTLNLSTRSHFTLDTGLFIRRYISLKGSPTILQLMKMYKIASKEYFLKGNFQPLILLLNDYPKSKWCILLANLGSVENNRRAIMTAVAINVNLTNNDIFYLIKKNFKMFIELFFNFSDIFEINIDHCTIRQLLKLTCDKAIRYDDFLLFMLKLNYPFTESSIVDMAEEIFSFTGRNMFRDVCYATYNGKNIYHFQFDLLEQSRLINDILPENSYIPRQNEVYMNITRNNKNDSKFKIENIITKFVKLKRYAGFDFILTYNFDNKNILVDYHMIKRIRNEINSFDIDQTY